MDEGRISVCGKPMNAYTASQVKDVLEEARRLEIIAGRGYDFVSLAVHKLDSLNSGRMDA